MLLKTKFQIKIIKRCYKRKFKDRELNNIEKKIEKKNKDK